MKNLRRYSIFPLIIFSLIIHGIILQFQLNLSEKKTEISQQRFKILNIRKIGEEKGSKENLLYIEKKAKQKKIQPNLKNLGFSDLPFPEQQEKKNVTKNKIIKTLDINNRDIKDFLKSTPPGHLSPSQALQAMSDTDVNIKLEVPKGIKEDELNKHELVFYSFQRRTVLAYVNSFQKELNNFERKNPHLRFPLTQDKQKLAGRVIYDKNGDILKIETLKWTNIKKLQDMFMKVLNNMSSLPNPPKEILDNEQFAINFVLTINN
jgi:hypothetical protein